MDTLCRVRILMKGTCQNVPDIITAMYISLFVRCFHELCIYIKKKEFYSVHGLINHGIEVIIGSVNGLAPVM